MMMIKKAITILTVGVVLAAIGAVGLAAQDVESLQYPKLNKIDIPDVERVTLDNGMRLYLLEDRSLPMFRVRARINCGSYLEPADKIGMAQICGMVMRTGGTEKWTGDEIDELLEGIGATVETNVDVTSASAVVRILSEYTDVGLEVLAEVLRRPVFDQDKIDLAKMQMTTGISRRNDDPGSLARREFKKLIYGPESPYARHTEYATVNSIDRQDLVNFHMAYIQPQNIQLSIWGDFDKKEMLEKIKSYFGDWEKGGLPVDPPPQVDYDYRSKVYYAEKTDLEQAYVRIGHIGGMVTDENYTDRIVMSSILGEGFGSRITDAVRTKLGLAYSTGGRYISNFAYPGYFFSVASTKPGSAVQATREMIKQIKSMQTDLPTESEMKKGKDGYLNSFVFNFDSRGEVLDRMMTYDFYGLPEDFLQKEKEGVENVTPEAVQGAANKWLRPDEMIVVVLGNAADFDLPLDSLGLGPVDTLDITIPPPVDEKEVVASEENMKKGFALLRKAAEAAGGVENLRKISAVAFKSNIVVESGENKLTVDREGIFEYPSRKRNVILMYGQSIYDVLNGESGWKTSNSTGILEPMNEDDVREARKDLARNPFFILSHVETPYYKAVYDGPDVIGDLKFEYISILDNQDETLCRLGIAEDGRLVCKSFFGMTAFGPGITDEIFSNEQEINGVMVPMETRRLMNGQKFGVETVSEFLINPEIADGSFGKPE